MASALPPDFFVAPDTLSAFLPELAEPVYPPITTDEVVDGSLFPECVLVTVGVDIASTDFDESLSPVVAADKPSLFKTSNFFVIVLYPLA